MTEHTKFIWSHDVDFDNVDIATLDVPMGKPYQDVRGGAIATHAWTLYHKETNDLREMVRLYLQKLERDKRERDEEERIRPKYPNDFISYVGKVDVYGSDNNIFPVTSVHYASVNFECDHNRVWVYRGTEYTEGPRTFSVQDRMETKQLVRTISALAPTALVAEFRVTTVYLHNQYAKAGYKKSRCATYYMKQINNTKIQDPDDQPFDTPFVYSSKCFERRSDGTWKYTGAESDDGCLGFGVMSQEEAYQLCWTIMYIRPGTKVIRFEKDKVTCK